MTLSDRLRLQARELLELANILDGAFQVGSAHECIENPLSYVFAKAGGVASLARLLRISPQAVSQWERVPVERVLEIERLTGVSRHALRPDIYPPIEPEVA